MKDKKVFQFAYELKQKQQSEEAEIMIFSSITSWKWSKEDPEVTASEFDKLLKEARKSGAKKLRLRINSPGGEVWQAVAMKTMLETSDFEEINVDIEGLCASAATFFCCIEGAHVRIAQGSEFMIHNPWCGLCGTADDFTHMAERLYKMQDDQHEMYAGRSGQTTQKVKEWMDAETWMNAKEAVANGFCDEIIQTARAAACADAEQYALMQEMYRTVPEAVAMLDTNVSIGAGKTSPSENINISKKEENNMEIKDINAAQLAAENPALLNEIMQNGAIAERTRIQEIEEMTPEGFEAIAQKAKEEGTTSADFLKMVVAEQKKRRQGFVSARAEETKPAQEITGGSANDHDGKGDDEEIDRYAKEMAKLAEGVHSSSAGMY